MSEYNKWIISKDASKVNVDDKFSFYLQHVFCKPKRTNPKRTAKTQTKHKRVYHGGCDGGCDGDSDRYNSDYIKHNNPKSKKIKDDFTNDEISADLEKYLGEDYIDMFSDFPTFSFEKVDNTNDFFENLI